MMGKNNYLNNMQKRKDQSNLPLASIQMNIFQSSAILIEGINYALVITDDCTGYQWLYVLKTKDDILKAMKWYSNIVELREIHNLLAVM